MKLSGRLYKAIQEEDLEPTAYFYLAQISLIRGNNEKAIKYINLALQLDEKIVEKIEKQPLFEPIKEKILIPSEPNKKINIVLTERELKTNEYLEKMFNLVSSMNAGNIFAQKEEKEQQLENSKEEKER